MSRMSGAQPPALSRLPWLLAPLPVTHRVFCRMVTNSSAAVGWIPTVLSKCDLVAPAFMAMAMPCIISGESSPTMWAPTTCTDARQLFVSGQL